MREDNKNKYAHNDDGTTHIFVESKSKYFPGKHTIIIDTEDWDKVKECSWSLLTTSKAPNKYPYVSTKIPHPDGGWSYYTWKGREMKRRRRIGLTLHHLIVGKPQKGMVVDHINHDGMRTGLDNRKENLRFVTQAQNQQNKRSRKNSSSQYKGVGWRKGNKKWQAQIRHKGEPTYIGLFTCEHQAALAYNEKATELWGENALLNEVEDSGYKVVGSS